VTVLDCTVTGRIICSTIVKQYFQSGTDLRTSFSGAQWSPRYVFLKNTYLWKEFELGFTPQLKYSFLIFAVQRMNMCCTAHVQHNSILILLISVKRSGKDLFTLKRNSLNANIQVWDMVPFPLREMGRVRVPLALIPGCDLGNKINARLHFVMKCPFEEGHFKKIKSVCVRLI